MTEVPDIGDFRDVSIPASKAAIDIGKPDSWTVQESDYND